MTLERGSCGKQSRANLGVGKGLDTLDVDEVGAESLAAVGTAVAQNGGLAVEPAMPY